MELTLTNLKSQVGFTLVERVPRLMDKETCCMKGGSRVNFPFRTRSLTAG